MTCPKCGTELCCKAPGTLLYEDDEGHAPHTTDRCIAALVRARDELQSHYDRIAHEVGIEYVADFTATKAGPIEAVLDAIIQMREDSARTIDAEARTAALEAKLKSAREALDIIATCPDEAVHLTPMIAQAAIAAIDKEGT